MTTHLHADYPTRRTREKVKGRKIVWREKKKKVFSDLGLRKNNSNPTVQVSQIRATIGLNTQIYTNHSENL